MSWIHELDFVRAVDYLIANEEIESAVNITALASLPNINLMRALGEAWGIGFGLPASEWMLAVATFVHRTESELLLKSRRVVPRRLLEHGFQFEFPNWPEAARDLVGRWRARPIEGARRECLQKVPEESHERSN